ncbi:hypothetical protein Zmor_001097 [Zophobas morio]|uniref:Uncharacterized protein n=1 Tax=Zophobas morio TaxID=2755281 RepID=A0AA38J6C4_9CUCU|nr:hypothetical protein Zmor_001097 [Zophobas morio]
MRSSAVTRYPYPFQLGVGSRKGPTVRPLHLRQEPNNAHTLTARFRYKAASAIRSAAEERAFQGQRSSLALTPTILRSAGRYILSNGRRSLVCNAATCLASPNRRTVIVRTLLLRRGPQFTVALGARLLRQVIRLSQHVKAQLYDWDVYAGFLGALMNF